MVAGGRFTDRGWLQEGVIRGSMLLSKTILPSDEELGKKDDDHKPGATARIPKWSFLNTSLRWRRRRILLAVLGLYLVYLFIHNLPEGLGEVHGRNQQDGRPIVPMTDEEQDQVSDLEPSGAPPGMRAPQDGGSPSQTYNGQIKFYRLAVSLHEASHTQGYHATNRNVLFAVSSLKSASTLLPMICEMSKWNRNYVHAAFVGREDIPLEDLLEINGVDNVKCPAIWHDGRPDFTEYSNEARAEASVMAALTHIHSFLHPQVAIMDDSLSEDAFFVRAMRVKTKELKIPLIEVPKDRCENFMWITRLDAGSLKRWHEPTVDIIIQVPSDASGGIIRLLKSIKEADYSGLKPPRLTIELPAEINDLVKQYLEKFRWPLNEDNPLTSSQMTIRRRITNQYTTPEDSAIRFLELFYPTSTTNSHVLLLSPEAQLSPLYYHYLKNVLLEHKYSSYGAEDNANLMGVSLELPSFLLDRKSKLTLPKLADMHTTRYKERFPDVPSVPFLWQAPNSHATLFFGDKWAELHSFLRNRVAKHTQTPKAAAKPKLVSETLPSWTEYLLELMRARGYSLYYPATSSSESLVTIHNELYHPPEEFLPHPPADPKHDAEASPKIPDEPFLRAKDSSPPPKNPELPVIPASRPLHLALPFEGDLPEISHLPYLLYDGEAVRPERVSAIASAYADKFRETVGGCKIPEGKRRKVEIGDARDLFCFGDEGDDNWEDNVVQTVEADVEDSFIGPLSQVTTSEVLAATPSATPTKEERVAAPPQASKQD